MSFDYGIDFRKKAIYSFFERKLLRKYVNNTLTDTDIKQYIYKSDTLFGYPIGKISMDKRIQYYKNVIASTADDVFNEFNREKKYLMKKRMLNRVRYMDNVCFFTQTFSPDKLPTDVNQYMHYWRQLFKRCKINHWVLVSDYGHKKDRLHFHGFLDLSSSSQFVEQDGKFFHFVPLKSYGYNKCIFLEPTCLERSVNYCLKYMFKDLSFESRHRLFGSRAMRCDTDFVNKLNDLLGVPVKIL